MIRSLVVLLGLWLLAPSPAPATEPLPGDSVYQLQAGMRDQRGQAVQWTGLRGKPRIATMFYSNCPFMCPLIIETAKGIDHALAPAERSRLGVVMVSLDPKRDTPTALAALAAKRGIDGDRWQLLQPQEKDLRAIAGVLGVRYRALADGGFNHSSVLVLLDADGRVVARTETMGARPDPEFLAQVKKLLAKP